MMALEKAKEEANLARDQLVMTLEELDRRRKLATSWRRNVKERKGLITAGVLAVGISFLVGALVGVCLGSRRRSAALSATTH